jgi:hypothetical protein
MVTRGTGEQCPWPYIPQCLVRFGVEDPAIAESMIQKWMTDCVNTHVKCQALFGDVPPLLPTRVLEIQGSEQVRLREVSKGKDRGQYSCLSHCWGGIVPLRLTSSMVQVFQDTEIPWETLPRTFQHAIDMTHRLGLRYIWIDSLCIIQDDIEDWRREGSQMSETYTGACITLAATSATGSNKGFYQETSKLYNLHNYSYTLRNHKDCESFYNIHALEIRDAASDFNSGNLPLLRRAWAFQERILTPRMVHFANDMLYWECTEKSACETLENMSHSVNKTSVLIPDVIDSPHSLSSDLSPNQIAIENWHTIVSGYTRGSLTFGKDKLPALQGVAKRVQSQRRCAYYAGLWENSLYFDLLWRSLECTTRTPEYRAPSWSWASKEGGVYWPNRASIQCHASVISVETVPAGKDPLGEVIAGTLVIKGLCLPAEIPHESKAGDTEHTLHVPGAIMLWQADHESNNLKGRNLTAVLITSEVFETYVSIYLVLRPTDTDNRVFQRVGIARITKFRTPHTDARFSMFDSTILQRYENNESWEGCQEYQEFTII